MAAEESWSHQQAVVNGVRLHWVEQGRGPLILLLHGFPEFWYSWRHQIPVLAERFRVVAPDLRGYNLSEKPPSGYDVETLSDDLLALIRALGEERAAIVGHDWGGVIAWTFAMRYPETTHKLVIINAPPRRDSSRSGGGPDSSCAAVMPSSSSSHSCPSCCWARTAAGRWCA